MERIGADPRGIHAAAAREHARQAGREAAITGRSLNDESGHISGFAVLANEYTLGFEEAESIDLVLKDFLKEDHEPVTKKLGGVRELARLTLPADVFVEAVRLASVPRSPIEERGKDKGYRGATVQRHYAAVEHLTAWWNESAPTDLRGAFSFMHYVKVPTVDGTLWASGQREEGYVSEADMQAGSRRGEAVLLDNIILVFYRAPITTSARWRAALNVDGEHGVECGLPEWLLGEEVIGTDAYDALHEFPSRFSEIWAKLQNM